MLNAIIKESLGRTGLRSGASASFISLRELALLRRDRDNK
jgi:hypothetical protein